MGLSSEFLGPRYLQEYRVILLGQVARDQAAISRQLLPGSCSSSAARAWQHAASTATAGPSAVSAIAEEGRGLKGQRATPALLVGSGPGGHGTAVEKSSGCRTYQRADAVSQILLFSSDMIKPVLE